MAKKRAKSPPEWFKAGDYVNPTQRLGLDGWATMLWARREHKNEYCRLRADKSALQRSDDRQVFWDAYFEDVRPSRYVSDPSLPLPSGLGPPRPIRLEDVTERMLNPRRAKSILRWEVGGFGARLLLVDPDVPDTELKKSFEAWLRQMRQVRLLPIIRRGRRSTNLKVDESHLATWANYQVLAVIDLDFYSKLFAKPKLTNPGLCKAILPDYHGDPTEWGKSARIRASEALDASDALVAQTQIGAGKKP